MNSRAAARFVRASRQPPGRELARRVRSVGGQILIVRQVVSTTTAVRRALHRKALPLDREGRVSEQSSAVTVLT